MLDGRIEQLGDPYDIYEHPSSAFVAGFIGQQNFFAAVSPLPMLWRDLPVPPS